VQYHSVISVLQEIVCSVHNKHPGSIVCAKCTRCTVSATVYTPVACMMQLGVLHYLQQVAHREDH